MAELVEDEAVRAYTKVPSRPPADFAAGWIARYEDGLADGSRIGFAIESHDGAFLVLCMFVTIEHEGR